MEGNENEGAEKESKQHEEKEKKYNERESPMFWHKFVKAATKAARKRHWPAARKAYAEFEYESSQISTAGVSSPEDDDTIRTSIYWEACQYLLPALYSRPPRLTTSRNFDYEDEAAGLASKIVTALGEHLKNESDYHDTMIETAKDLVHADKASAQVKYEFDFADQEARIPLTMQETENGMEFFGPDGSPWLEDVSQDLETYSYFGMGMQQAEVNKRIMCMPLPFDDVIHTPSARYPSEIKEMGFYFCLSKDEAAEAFGEEVVKGINWVEMSNRKRRGQDETDYTDERQMMGEFIEGWECYCLESGHIYFISDQYPNGFLHETDDTNQLKDFFPCPKFAIGTKPRKSMYPVPVHARLKYLANQLDYLAEKKAVLLESIERKAIVAGDETLLAALNSSADTYVVANNVTSILEKGGVQNMIWFLPIQELVTSLTETLDLEVRTRNDYFEKFGVPDILRGASDPQETLGAQQLKSTAVNDRFKLLKNNVYRLARDLLRLMIDLALAKLSDEEIGEIAGFQFFDERERALIPQAMAILRSDKSLSIHIDIETDSLSYVDEYLRSAEIGTVTQATLEGMNSIAQTIQNYPRFAAVQLKLLMHTLESSATGRNIQRDIKEAVDEMIQEAMQPPPQQPPPPDYEMLKIQLQGQEMQLKAQSDAREAQAKEYKLMLDQSRLEVDAQAKNNEAALVAQKQNFEFSLQQFVATLEAQRVEIEKFKAQQQAMESQMEEIRLAREVQIQEFQAQQPPAPEKVEPQIINVSTPPVNVVVDNGTSPEQQMLAAAGLLGPTIG